MCFLLQHYEKLNWFCFLLFQLGKIENHSKLWTILLKPKRSFTFLLKSQLFDPIFVFHLYFAQGKFQMSLTLPGNGTCFFSQGHGGNCHYMSNVIFGMMQGNNAFKHFHFLTLGYRFYLGLFAWSSQHNFTAYHWRSIITIPSSFCDHFDL